MIKLFTAMNSRPDFAAIEAFTRVAELGSFRAAATALGAPVSTVSVQVSRLEQRLGTRLLARTTRRVSLTDEGRRYFEEVRVALDTVLEAERAVAGQSDAVRGRLRIASPVEFGQNVLGRVLGRYGAEYPDVSVEVELRGDRVDPVRDGFDVALQCQPPDSLSLVARKVGAPTVYHLVASPAYLARCGQPEHPRDLTRFACLVLGTRQSLPAWTLQRASTRTSLVHRQATANSWSVLAEMAVGGCGIALLPDFLAIPRLADGSLVPVLDGFTAPPDQMYAVYARSRHVPRRVATFVSALASFLDVWPGCLKKTMARSDHERAAAPAGRPARARV